MTATAAKTMTSRSKIKRWLGAATLALVSLTVMAGGGYYVWLTTPPAMPTTLEEAVDLLQSPRYLRLPENRRFDYMKEASRLFDEASSQDKREVMKLVRANSQARDAFGKAMQDRFLMEVNNYVHADTMGRQVMVDRMIAMQRMMESRFADRPRKEGDDARRKARRDRHRDEFARTYQQQIQHGSPQNQAYAGELFKAIMDRRVQMGLTPWPEVTP
jgi:hypothetical protein